MHSTVTGEIIDGRALDASYWARNLRDRVLFADAVRKLAEDGNGVFLELSPHPILLPSIEQGLVEGSAGAWAARSSLRRNEPERAALLASLGALYTAGFPVDFHSLYAGGGRCIPLPGYPWQRQRLWLDNATTGDAGGAKRSRARSASGHPLLGPCLRSAQSGARHWEMELSVHRFSYLADHQVRGVTVLPAAAYLEMVLAAAAEAFGSGPHTLRQVSFKEVLILPEDAGRMVQLVISRATTTATFEVYSAVPDGSASGQSRQAGAADEAAPWTLHASGTISLGDRPSAAELAHEPIAGLLEGFTETLSAEQHDQEMRRRGLEYGPAFRGVAEIRRRPGEAVARLRLPEEAGTGPYKIHPALLDAAFQVLIVALGASGGAADPGDPTYLPVGLEEVRIHAPPTSESWAHVRLDPERADLPSARRGDVRLLDADGRVLVEAMGLRLERFDRSARAAADRARGPHPYEIRWEVSLGGEGTAKARAPSGKPERWIVLGDREGVGARLKAELEARGATCVFVVAGERFEARGPGQYVVNPSQPDDFRSLFEVELGSDRPSLSGVVHLFALDVESPCHATAWPWSAAQRLGCTSALHLVQALTKAGVVEPPRLVLITRGAQATLDKARPVSFAQAPLWGLGRVIALEHPELRCTMVDLDPSDTKDEIGTLAGELLSETEEAQIALREGTRLVARLVERPYEDPGGGAGSTVPGDRPIRPDGAYLITGGLGGLGLSVARWMVERGARHLVLMGRSDASSAAVHEALAALSRDGAHVVVERADVAEEADVMRVLSTLRRGPKLRGIVHAAGILDDAPLVQTTVERVEQVMAPKIAGAFNLHCLTLSEPLDMFVLFSSVASVLGSAAQGGYAAANAFLDALSHYRRSQNLPAISIQWGPWSEIGLAAREDRSARLARLGLESMTPEEGVHALEQLLQTDAVEVAVTSLDAERFCFAHPFAATSRLLAHLVRERGVARGDSKDRSLQRALEAAGPGRARRVLLESHLCRKLAEVLRLSPSEINPSTPLRNLGLDSLMSLEFGNRISASLGIRLSATLVWNHPTIALLAQFLANKMGLPIDPPSPLGSGERTHAPGVGESSVRAQVLSEIKDLAEREVEALLLEELRDIGQ
jgi:myxalamid-type polyketide synthase MxaE and MxaD